MFQLGIDRILNESSLCQPLIGRRIALLGHPASLSSAMQHSLDALISTTDLHVSAAFGPQHGIRGDKQDNMVETGDAVDPVYGIPVFSLYGPVRRPSDEMMASFDVMLVDLQDVGCRVYTFLTTLFYMMQACAHHHKALWVLDRPNPAGRGIEGLALMPGFESFVGAAPLCMRHGLTLAEAALWYRDHAGLDLELEIVGMQGYAPAEPPGFGWPLAHLAWVNPSPNLATLNGARCYSGTVLLEGTELSEGRGTTRPLELLGAPGLDVRALLATMQQAAPDWLAGCRLRPCFFEPTFHKYQGQTCSGLQIHTDYPGFDPVAFRPFRLISILLKSLRQVHPGLGGWRDFEYEYENSRLPIDTISGSALLRQWVDDPASTAADLEVLVSADEAKWAEDSRPYYLY